MGLLSRSSGKVVAVPTGSQAEEDHAGPRRRIAAQAAGPAAVAVAAVGLYLGARAIKKVFDTPSRPYKEGNVGNEYDAWTQEGILEHYWGDHIHLGYYTEEVRARLCVGRDSW